MIRPSQDSAAYQRMVHRRRAYGTWRPFVDAEPIRRHLAQLQANGLGRRRIAELAGLHPSTVSAIIYGREGEPNAKVRPATAHKLLAIKPGATGYTIDATGTIRRVQALMAAGWTQVHLAKRLGVTPGRVSDILRRDHVLPATAETITRLYDELRNANPLDHGATAHGSNLVRKYAAARKWRTPDYWDDNGRIDDPTFDPEAADKPRRRIEQITEDTHWLLATGLDRDQIAERLGISRSYVDRALREHPIREEIAA